MTPIRRLDHVAVLVRSTDEALRFYRDHLGLAVHSTEEIEVPPARLTYLDAGNAYVQLVEPLDDASPLGTLLDEQGEGLHHICFGVDDVPAAVTALSDSGTEPTLGSGRGRLSSFLTADGGNGVRIECTEFRRDEDADATRGWLEPAS